MARSYSVLILPREGTRLRRVAVSTASLLVLLFCGVALLGLGGWAATRYWSMRVQLKAAATQLAELRPVEADIRAQQARLASLRQTVGHIQELMAHWKGLQKNVRASLPPRHRKSPNGHVPLEDLEKNLVSLKGELEQLIASVPTAWPINGHVSSGFGMRKDPWTKEPEYHSGLDIPKAIGTPIQAPGDAVVERVSASNGNGKLVVLDHGEGITTLYAHLSKIHVKEGQRVRKGQVIADVGNTGSSTNPHLHYEVRVKGIPIDPRRKLIEENSPSS